MNAVCKRLTVGVGGNSCSEIVVGVCAANSFVLGTRKRRRMMWRKILRLWIFFQYNFFFFKENIRRTLMFLLVYEIANIKAVLDLKRISAYYHFLC